MNTLVKNMHALQCSDIVRDKESIGMIIGKVLKKSTIGVFIVFMNVAMAIDFDKEISLEKCLSIPKCNQGVLSKGGWSSTDSGIRNSKIKDIRCNQRNGRANLGCMGLDIRCDERSGCWIGCGDGWGCWTVYDQACRDMDLNLQEKMKNFSYIEIWERKASYFETNLPKEIWSLIQQAAQFEIDCFERMPPNAKGPQGAVYKHCPDLNHPTQNCNSVKDFTKMYSKEILTKTKKALYKKWNGIANAQSNFNINESPRNLSLLEGEFSSLRVSYFDEYYNLINDMSKSTSLPKKISDYIDQEKKLLMRSKKIYEQKCSIVGNESLAILDEKERICTRFYLTDRDYNIFEEKKNKRLKNVENEFWENARRQAKDSPYEAIREKSLIEDYLVKYPNGTFVKQAEDLYEKTLVKEGVKEAKQDTVQGLSENSLLQKYLSKYPHGQFAEQTSNFLENLLFNYSISQIKKDAKNAILPNSYPEQYMQKYPNGKYRDSLNVFLEDIYWKTYSARCENNQTMKSCAMLLDFLKKFPKSKNLDSVKILLDEPMWSSIDENTCIYIEDNSCTEIERYIEIIPQGKHVKEANKIITKAGRNSEKRDLEDQKIAEREERVNEWYSDYKYISEGCSFNTKNDSYDFEWNEEISFPEKNGVVECIEKKDLSLDSLDTLIYKCIETNKIFVRNGKVSGGKGFCINALQDTLIKKTYLSNGKTNLIMSFPKKITLTINEKGIYSITSKKIKLNELEFSTAMHILSFVKTVGNLSHLYSVDNVMFEWSKSGQIKNIRLKELDENGKVRSKLNIPLNSKGEISGVSEIYTGPTGNFKIEWNNGTFKRIFGGGKKLKASLCPDYVCNNLIEKLYQSKLLHHYVPIIESSRETAEYEGLEEGWMLYYISFLLGISINQGLEIWSAL